MYNIMFLKLILSSGLAIIAVGILIDDDMNDFFPQSYIVPKYYNIMLTSYIENYTFFGTCSINIEIFKPTQSIRLYSKVTNITEVIVFTDPPKIVDEAGYKSIHKSIYGNNIVEYLFKDKLPSGNYTLKLTFVNIKTNITNLRIFHDRNKQWLAMYLDATGTSNLFPHFLGTSTVPFKISIARTLLRYAVLSNIPIQKVEINDKNMMVVHFETTLDMPKYLLFLNNIFFQFDVNENVKVNTGCRTYCDLVHEVAKNITPYLFNKLKRLNKTWTINHVVIMDFQDEDIINENLVVYRKTDIIFHENLDPIAKSVQVALFVADKVVQECFYYENSLWSSSSWFNKAIVTFLEYYTINEAIPDTQMINLFVVQIQHESLHFDTKYNTSLYNTSLSSFESPRYIRASSVLRMLQNMITEEIFWESIRIYVQGNDPSPDYFHEVVENLMKPKTANDVFEMIAFTMKQLMNYWIDYKYCPVVEVIRDYDDPILSIQMRIVNFDAHTSPNYYLLVPVTYTTQTYHNFTYKSTIFLNQYFQTKFNIKENGWILFNLQQTGYYRVNYDIENWRRIASYLDSENYTKIHVLNRAQIIDDAFHLMITYQLNSTVFWNIAEYLKRETDYIPWYPTFKALEYLSNVFLFRETRFFNIKIKIRHLLHKMLEEFGYNEVPSNQSSLRLEAAKWACSLDDRTCIQRAGHNLKQHLADSKKNKLLPWWREWTYCQGFKVFPFEDSPWWGVYYLGKEKFRTIFLKFLACSENSEFIKDYLNLIKNDSTTSIIFLKDFSDQDYINYFLLTIAKHARNPEVLDFTLQNLENIKPKQISEYAAFTVIINHVSSTEQLEKISNFLTDKFTNAIEVELNEYKKIFTRITGRDAKVSELYRISEEFNNMKKHIFIIQSKVRIRSFEIESQMNYFQSFVVTD